MPTLRDFRHRAAPEFGPFLASVSAAGSSTTTKLVDDNWPVKTQLEVASLYQDQFLFRPDAVIAADRERYVKTYDPSTGTLFPDKSWANAPAGEAYELHGLVRPAKLHELINLALRQCYIQAEIAITPTSTREHRFCLTTTHPWLTNELWLRQAGYLGVNESRDEYDPFKRPVYGTTEQRGQAVYIDTQSTFNLTDTIYVLALQPAYFATVHHGPPVPPGEYGLMHEDDEAPVAENWLAAGVLVEGWRQFAQLLDDSANRGLVKSQAEAWAWFRAERQDNLVVPELNFRPLRQWGPRR